MGIPVEGQRGVGGGYRVRPGFRLPPLMLSGDEAVVVVLGLLAARRQGLESSEGSVDGALAKIHRVLPDLLRRRVEALETTLGFTAAERDGRARRQRRRAARRRGDPPRPPPRLRLPRLHRRGDRARRQPARARRPLRAAGTSPRTTTAAPTGARSASTGWQGRARRRPVAGAAEGLRRRRPRQPLARERPVALGGGRPARPRRRRGRRARPGDASPSSSSQRRGNAAPHARRIARLDGRRPRPPRLPRSRSTSRTSSGRASARWPSRLTAALEGAADRPHEHGSEPDVADDLP